MADQEPIDTPNEDNAPDSAAPNPAEDALDAAQDAMNQAQDAVGGGEEQPTPEEQAMLDMAKAAIAQANGDTSETDEKPTPEEQAMLDMASQAVGTAQASVNSVAAPPTGATPMDLPQFLPEVEAHAPEEIALLSDVNLNVKIELGRTRMLVEDVLRLGSGAVVELDKLAGDPVDVFVNERLVARGEVLVLNDSFCVRISEIVSVTTKEPGS